METAEKCRDCTDLLSLSKNRTISKQRESETLFPCCIPLVRYHTSLVVVVVSCEWCLRLVEVLVLQSGCGREGISESIVVGCADRVDCPSRSLGAWSRLSMWSGEWWWEFGGNGITDSSDTQCIGCINRIDYNPPAKIRVFLIQRLTCKGVEMRKGFSALVSGRTFSFIPTFIALSPRVRVCSVLTSDYL